jgi:hypothetical protein
MERKSAMAYPAPLHHGQASIQPSAPKANTPTPRCQSPSRSIPEGDHQVEKLQFALAVALSRGDLPRSQELRDQIAALGEDLEEPGT